VEIPKLGVKMNIQGVPQSVDGSWDVAWLGNEAGWLQRSAYPTWSGNSVLTGHVSNAFGQPGPFAALNTLGWGDQIIIHASGAEYVYAVRSVKQISPQDGHAMMQHEDSPWITLVTCRGYDETSNSYLYRLLVRAVLVEVK
jgi:LPXTG-site transpeptidase (sortase) family protein